MTCTILFVFLIVDIDNFKEKILGAKIRIKSFAQLSIKDAQIRKFMEYQDSFVFALKQDQRKWIYHITILNWSTRNENQTKV